jgi:hypothetical protein
MKYQPRFLNSLVTIFRACTVPAILSCLLPATATCGASSPDNPIITRLYWQDRDTQTLQTADIVAGDQISIRRHKIKGFPKLDPETQNLVQMNHIDGVLLAGVRDNDDGGLQSGWVAVNTGVSEEAHGDHTHWRYRSAPEVLQMRLDEEQGNPAHLYVYGQQFFLANDRKNGFTRLTPDALKRKQGGNADFFSGGGNHITIACSGPVAYSTWIDGGGPNAGRVDVVNLAGESCDPAYSLTLPTGGVHGATANSGRIFFAPQDGICWVDADHALQQSADKAVVHHIALGKDEENDRPLRTGAFANHRNWVLFATGSGQQSAIGIIDASEATPSLQLLNVDAADGLRPMTPVPVLSMGRRFALFALDRTDNDVEETEQLCVVDLDPDRNQDLSDAALVARLPVSPSQIRGHYGHHGITFDAYGRYAFVSHPAEGRITVLRMKDKTWVADFKVGGHPDTLLAVGGKEFDD